MNTIYSSETTLGTFRVVRNFREQGTGGARPIAYVATRTFHTYELAEAEAEAQAKQNPGHMVEVVQVTGQYTSVPHVVRFQSNE